MSRSRHQHKKTYKLGIPAKKIKKQTSGKIRTKVREAILKAEDENAFVNVDKKVDYLYII